MKTVPTRLMEDHRDAYFLWKEIGLKGLPCLHVDAHLDVSDLKAPGNELVYSPEINCGNFLLPAMRENIVSSLIWVIPEHLPGGEELLDWSYTELQNWLHLELSDYMSLKQVGRRVEGTLLGKPFVICFSEDIPDLQGPVLLDIDVDYFLSPTDEVWQSPATLAEHVAGVSPAATTIAYSLLGGYTPPKHRYLGPLMEQCLSDLPLGWEIWEGLSQSPPQAKSGWPSWTKTAALALSGGLEEAVELDPAYSVQPIDMVCGAMMRSRFEEAGELLSAVVNPTESRFIEGMLYFRSRRFSEAADLWEELLSKERLDAQTEVYLRTLCGRALLEAQRPQEALNTLTHALGLSRRDSEITYLLARAEVALRRSEDAAKSYRRAIKFAPDRLETAALKLELAEVYLQLGQMSLARRLLHQLVSGDTPGFMKLRAEALKLKLHLGKSI